MLDAENPAENPTAENSPESTPVETPAEKPAETPTDPPVGEAPAKKAAAKKATTKKSTAKKTTAKKTTTKKTTTKKTGSADEDGTPVSPESPDGSVEPSLEPAPAKKAASKRTSAKRTTAKKTAAKQTGTADDELTQEPSGDPTETTETTETTGTPPPATALLFQPPEPPKAPPRKKKADPKPAADVADDSDEAADDVKGQQKAKKSGTKAQVKDPEPARDADADSDEDADEQGGRRRRRRGGRRRRKSGEGGSDSESASEEDKSTPRGGSAGQGSEPETAEGESTGSRRRRRRRRSGEDGDAAPDDPQNTVTRVRKQRSAEDEITAVTGSTRLEAKKQRRREGREAGRRRAPIASEAEFLARREAVDRVMVIRQRKDLTQIAVLEDKVLVEHYVARESQTSLIGNVYLGRVQNVLPSMEAAFIDIGKGRNAVLYAGEVNWDALGAKGGGQRKIEQVLKSGQSVLVQVTKDPIGHKGARLTSQVSLPGRFLVYVPDGTTSGISRKLPDTERNRLKTLLKEIVPDTAGVIVRTAAEGASEEELTRDVERLTARWADIETKINGSAPQLLYGEPDLTLKVVRDLFTEDFSKLVVSGADAWDMVDGYVKHVAPDLEPRLERYDGKEDAFSVYRIDEQIAKGLDRKVWLPSGGSLIIDRTEAMTVVDVNTGKFTGSGGNLEETVTKNNLEAAEEIVRQLRLRDIGGIIVVDFIDMVLESNRDLVLRRMVECLGRDRTRHQVAEVTSLGLVQMTRKRIGTGLLEAFSETCEQCQGRGVIVHQEPLEPKKSIEDEPRRGRRGGGRGRDSSADTGPVPSPNDVAAIAKADQANGKVDEKSDGGPGTDREEPGKSGVDVSAPAAVEEPAGESARSAEEKPTEEAREQESSEDRPAEEQPSEEKPAKRSSRSRSRARRAEAPPSTTTPAPEETRPVDVTADDTGSDVEAGEPAVADKPVADESVDDGSGTSPVELGQPAEPTGPTGPTEPAEPAAPKIVTSVRRRGAARRPAGPPASSSDGAAGAPDASPAPVSTSSAAEGRAPETDELPLDVPEPVAAAHVPVKKRGSRKR